MAGRTSLVLVTPPSVEPVVLADVKSWIKQDGSDDDDLITALITASRGMAEKFLRRALITQVWKMTIDLEHCGYGGNLPAGTYDMPITMLYGGLPEIIEIPMPPLQSVGSVTTYDINNCSSVFDPSNYIVDLSGQRIILNETSVWPGSLRARATCEVVFTVGYGDTASTVPQAIRSGMMMHIQRMYDQRLISQMPQQSEQLMKSYKIYGER